MMKKWTFLIVGFFSTLCFTVAQTKTVGGLVTDETGEPIIGASVQVKGTTIGIITDVEGKFSLQIPENVRTLTFSYLGYESMDVAVSPNMRVQLKTSSTVLDEIVVTGITKTDKRLFTGSADKLDASKIRLDGIADVSRALEGRSAGVSVQNVTGTFGTAPKIRVRGSTSIFGSSKPLWVVDGVIMEDIMDVSADDLSSGDAKTLISSAISGINAEDIESFDILKDGSASSIYGARAMAGVIVITTKKGGAGVNKINYTGEYTYRMKPLYSEFNIMNSQDQMSVYQEMEQKGWLKNAERSNASSSGIYGKMYQMVNSGELLNTAAARNAYLREAEYRNTDWFDLLFNDNLMHKHSVSMSSGTEKSYYYASISALLDNGWTKQSKVALYTANLNATYNLSKTLNFNMIANASYRNQRAPGTLSGEIDPVYGEVKRDFDINPYSYALNTSRALEPHTFYRRSYADFNILNELDNNYMDLGVTDTRIQGLLSWKALPDLELTALGAVRYNANSQEHNITDHSNQAMAYRAMPNTIIRDRNPFLYTDPDNPYAEPVTVLPEGGIYNRDDRKMLSYDFRATALYNKIFDETHIINVLGGLEVNSTDRHQTWFRGWGMQYDMGEIPYYDYQIFKKGQEENTQYYSMDNTFVRSIAYFANGTYSYKGKYSLNGTIRYEGTNKLGKTTTARWLPTWNVGFAWNAHEEDFFQSLKPAFSTFVFRTSYSLTADRGPAFVTNSRAVIRSYNPWRPTAAATESGLRVESLENEDLTYEKKHEFALGVDMGFLNNRINTELAWYKRNNYDLIGFVYTQSIGGESVKYGNVASMKSNGVEISLSTRNIVTKDFTWTTDFIYSHTKNEITDLISRQRMIDYVTSTGFAQVGYPNRSIFSIPFAGLSEEGYPIVINEMGEKTSTNINFQEVDSLQHLVYSGPSEPTDFGSFGNILTYKNFRLNVFFTYSWGNVVRLDPIFKSEYSELTAMPKEFRNRWSIPGDEEKTNIPVIASLRQVNRNGSLVYGYNAYNYSTARIAQGDFIRLKEVSLSYDFKGGLLKTLRLSDLSLKLQATNLLLLYADKKLNGQDPEFFNTGGVASPVPRQFTMTLRLGL
jgi:TonB-linked SusC/RagA family outer membrane protein